MVEQFSVRLRQAVLLDRFAPHPGRGLQRRGAARGVAEEGGVLHPPVRRCAGAVELRLDQPAGAARDARQRRPEPGQGAEQPARRPGEGRRAASHQHDRRKRLRARQERRRHAGQGRVPDRPDAADPVRADHRRGLPAAAADHPALDQQVLHPRPEAEQQLHPLGARSGTHGVRGVVGQSRQAPGGQGLRGLHARGLAGGDRRRVQGHRRSAVQRHRLLPGRHSARLHPGVSCGQGRRPHRLRHVLRQPAGFLRSRASSACSSTRSRSPASRRR